MSGGGGSETVTTDQTPWMGQQPYLLRQFERAERLPRQEPYPFPGVVPYAPSTVEAMGRTIQRARSGSPVLGIGQLENMLTTSGAYLDPTRNPMFWRAFQGAARNVLPQVQGQAVAAGRYGGGLARRQQIEALGDVFAQQWAPLYSGERERMLRASMMSPSLAQADYYDIGMLGQVGQMQESRAREALADAQQRWYMQQQAPYQQIQTQSPIIAGQLYGTQGTQQVPTQGMSPAAGAMGGAMMGTAIMPGWGTAIGAGLGLMASMM